MRLRLTLLLYNLLLPFAMCVLVPVMLVERKRRGGTWSAFWERWGIFGREVRERLSRGQGRTWWLNAGSVGEVNVAVKLIAEIFRREPDRPLVLSVTTSTGRALAEQQAPPGVTIISCPLDQPPIVWRMMRLVQPARYVPVESELWPNLLRSAQKRSVPVILANARLSPRSERRYRRLRALVQPVFAMLSRVLVQEQEDAARWEGLGVPHGRVLLTGSIKYDEGREVNAERVEEYRALLHGLWDDPLPPVLLAASTHAGEEKALAEVFLELRREFPRLVILVVPRHVERRGEVNADLTGCGLRPALRSAWSEAPLHADALIIDTTGELRDWQALASVVVIGKSFLAVGGQNPAEAIAAGVPVVTGPHMENFLPLMNLLQRADGIRQVPSLEALAPALRELFAQPEASAALAARGRAALERHRGATVRTVDAIAEFPATPPPAAAMPLQGEGDNPEDAAA